MSTPAVSTTGPTSPATMAKIGFVDLSSFVEKYRRNNKETGIKNLRCFPTCGPNGHTPHTFCGTGVKFCLPASCDVVVAEFSLLNGVPSFTYGETVDVARLRQTKLYFATSFDRVVSADSGILNHDVGKLVSLIHARKERHNKRGTMFTKDEEAVNNSNQPGEIVDIRSRHGWNYDWASNRHSCLSLHCLRAYVFQILDETNLRCLGSMDSPVFQVYSRRRSQVKAKQRTAPPMDFNGKRKRADSEEDGKEGRGDEFGEADDEDEKPSIAKHAKVTPSLIFPVMAAAASPPAVKQYPLMPTLPKMYAMQQPQQPTSFNHTVGGPSAMMDLSSMRTNFVNIPIFANLLERLELTSSGLFGTDPRVQPLFLRRAFQSLYTPAGVQSDVIVMFMKFRELAIVSPRKQNVCWDIAKQIADHPELIVELRTMVDYCRASNVDYLQLFAPFFSAILNAVAKANPTENLWTLFIPVMSAPNQVLTSASLPGSTPQALGNNHKAVAGNPPTFFSPLSMYWFPLNNPNARKF